MTTLPTPARNDGQIVIMDRTDGLGERLCAMMNAIRFADILKLGFGFYWEGDIWNPVYHKLDVKDKNAVLGQSISTKEEIFSQEFIAQYSVDDYQKSNYSDFPKRPITLDKVLSAKSPGKGWRPNQSFMEDECHKSFLAKTKLSYYDAFEKLEFSPEIATLIHQARAVKLGKFNAIHLRSGDMVFGEVRKWGQWYNKVLNPSVAKDMIAKSKAKGVQVVLFGQDVNALQELAQSQDCIYVGDLLPSQSLSPTQRAFFEIIIMSRAKQIFAGYSGFSRAACMIGGIKATTPISQYSIEDYADITLADLKSNQAKYHPMVAAYSYWQAYAMGKAYFNLPEQVEITRKAYQLDPENLLHLVTLSALLLRMGQDEEADKLIAEHAKKTKQDTKAVVDQFSNQLTFKYYSTDFSHKHEFNDFRGAARRDRAKYAKGFVADINRALSA